jgi:hypothetical protein
VTNDLINDFLRSLISRGVRFIGALIGSLHSLRIPSFRKHQDRLRRKYRITATTPVHSYDALEPEINAKAAEHTGKVRLATTSGSTSSPKRLLFTKRRLRSVKLIFVSFFVRCCWTFSVKRTSLYVFGSFHPDESLTSMLLEERRLPSYFSTLQAPYRVQYHPAMNSLASQYGTAAVRLWVMVLSNPGVLYSTNPSTISTFLDDLTSNWQHSSQFVRDWHSKPEAFAPIVQRIAKRISARGWRERCAKIVESENPVPFDVCVPGVTTYICWTGGYVKPFLERLRTYLPGERYRLIPMYSMSTETIETIGDFRCNDITFLPTATGVLYEFMKQPHTNGRRLLKPHELKPGELYAMVVSDAYGLRRYDTGDLFLCQRKVNDLPDLRFVGRRNLEYSFTGEKLTAEQVCAAFEAIRAKAQVPGEIFLTCIPSHPSTDSIPHYKIVALAEQLNGFRDSIADLQLECDRLFAELNCEYEAKRETGRLGPVRLVTMDRGSFINLTSYRSQSKSWEAQFKFLPLYVQTWEVMNAKQIHRFPPITH